MLNEKDVTKICATQQPVCSTVRAKLTTQAGQADPRVSQMQLQKSQEQ